MDINSSNFIEKAKEYIISHFSFYKDIVVLSVWFNYSLGNMKGMFVSSNGNYYEVIYNKSKDEIYIDEYRKVRHLKFES